MAKRAREQHPARSSDDDGLLTPPLVDDEDATSPTLAAVKIAPAVPYGNPQGYSMEVVDNEERAYWVAWNRVRWVGPARFARLLAVFGDAATAWVAPTAEMRACGFDTRLIAEIGKQRQTIDPAAELDRLARLDVVALLMTDMDYPRLLREIALPPAVLYVRGELLPVDENAIAVIGTRRISAYGRLVTERLTRDLVAQGMTIVSGLARGVDSVAHTAALDAGGRTIAVLGCGPDLVYPADHAQLAERIVSHGAVISEFAVGVHPEAGNFPARNRIISGMSSAVLVTEAPERSGALITTDFASDQGREVMAVPGNIYNKMSTGCNRLIQQGALCVVDAADVIGALNMHLLPQQLDMRELLPTDATEGRVLLLLVDGPLHIDDLCRQTELPASTISGTLIMLELKGRVRNLGGMTYGRL